MSAKRLKETTLVAVNGLGGLEYQWDRFAAAVPMQVRLRVLDLLGHGGRPAAHDYRYAALVADVDQRTRDLEPFPLVGWSVGGAVAWLFAARNPQRVTRLVLLDPAAPHQSPFRHGPTPQPLHPYTYASVEKARSALSALDPTVTDDDVRRGYRQNADGRWEPRFDPAIFPAIVEDARDHGEEFGMELERITVATLILKGERSFLRAGQMEEIAGMIPDARLATVANAGHFMIREQPEQTVRLIMDFLES